jgi:outer membrane protein assembly factor BamA
MIPAWMLLLALVVPLWVVAEPLSDAQIIADSRLESRKITELRNYLQRYVGKKAKKSVAVAAENFLQRLYFISTAACEIKNNKLICTISPKLKISNINIENLPASLLESELLRKIPVQRGQLIAFDQKDIQNFLDLTRSRVRTFLRKFGYYGAQIHVNYVESKDDLSLVFNIKIEGGAFARVNSVSVDGNSIINKKKIQNIYRRMCLSFKDISNAFFLWSFACYSRELEREATDELQEKLARLGYVRARIRVQHEWLDPHARSTPRHCQKKDAWDTQPRCVDLRIDIDPGPKVRWSINIIGSNASSRNAFTRIMGSLFAVDNFSRATLPDDNNYYDNQATDQIIIKQELEKQINFVEAKNIDEQELKISEEKMTKYLVSKGYTNAEVVASYVQQDSDNILVNFDVYPGSIYYIRSIKIEPNIYENFIDQEEFHNLVKRRSVFASGHLSYPEIDFAKSELIRMISEKGFTNVEAFVDMTAVGAGAVDLVFHISSEPRNIIDKLIIVNGVDDLNNQVISTLKNCDNFKNNSCQDSSFLPEHISNDEKQIRDFYELNEYVYVKVRNQVVKENDKNILIFFLYDSRFPDQEDRKLEKQYVKNMIISGNSHTNENVIRRLFPRAKQGDGIDFLSLKKGISNIRETGRFSRIDQKLMAAQENSNSLYFALQVIERPSLSIDTSLGFSTDQLLMLEAELEETNLFSSMLSLKTKLSLGLFWGRQSSLNNKFIWPFIWGKPFIFTLHAPIIIYDDKSNREKPFRRLQSKIISSLDWRASFSLSPSIRYYLVYNQQDDSPQPLSWREKFNTLDGLITTIKKPGKFISMLKPGVSYANLDNPFDPRSGVNLYNWVELSVGPLAGTTSFVNWGTENRFYVPLGSCTLALQATFMRAFMTPNDTNFKELSAISSMDKLGGDRSVRGYEEGALGKTSTNKALGSYSGYLSNTANIELRFPITQSGTWGNFSGALFVDQGMLIPCEGLFKCGSDLSFDDLVKTNAFGLSVGAGIRYKLPVGPLSVDYGISPLRPKNRNIHFQFGYAF